ncbi:OmpA family protein [Exilibacterium tricleocarpae]|uniref:OmpA family protein n=1 Tax=Exilibacterium tricleocarpae TaxID=2591008 RepID=A0A545T5U9_9GAMM|nr:OmpA family protein [Exilibacterium tricleocarpae]TQV72616.1 OmpA family protein [Exilibacterium tricleocarpae]
MTTTCTRNLRGALCLALATALSGPTLAADHQAELQLGIGRYFFDSDRDLDDANHINLGLGYVLNRDWMLEGRLVDFDADAERGGIDFDGRHYHLDALYHFSPTGKWRPFIIGGLGAVEFDPDNGSAIEETLLNLGVGVKYALSERWQLRGDARLYNSLDEETLDYGLNLGLSYLFGVKPRAPARPPAPADADGDGVYDSVDACPGTAPGVRVDGRGCEVVRPVDSDGDGVYDRRDRCPDTAPRLKVDGSGCPITLTDTVSIDLRVNFDTNSSVVKPEFYAEIKQVADFMAQYANTVVTIEGHTDNRGAASYNQALSQRRAEAVARVLTEQFAVGAERVRALGYGEAQPIADNDTAAGQLANRRVVAKISAEVETQQLR